MKKVEIEHGYYTVDDNNKYHSWDGQPAISIESYTEVGENDEFHEVEGYQAWYNHGELHREGDLPAVIRNNGKKFFYENGQFIKEE